MPKTKKVDEVATLARRLLEALEMRRRLGGDAYPPTLRQLAESCEVEPEDDRLFQAVTRAAFTKVANAKATGQAGLDHRVYFKEDVPRKPTRAEIERLAVAELAGRMLAVLESQRELGGDAYPPSLQRLAELCELPPEDVRILKAAKDKAFSEKAKPLGKLGLGAPIYFAEDVPTPEELKRRAVVALAGRMLDVLESQRKLGGDAYPPSLGRLAELCETNASNELVPKAASHESFAKDVTIAVAGKNLDAPAFFTEDFESDEFDLVPALLTFALGLAKGDGKSGNAFTADKLKSKLKKSLQDQFAEALRARLDRQELPEEYAWVQGDKGALIFLLADLRPEGARPAPPAPTTEASPPDSGFLAPASDEVPPAPGRDFAGAFREAFGRVDRENGATNLVFLADLRREMAGFDREDFDAGLRRLREAGEYSLGRHEGQLRFLTTEEREAGITEEGILFVYVSRR